MWDAAEVDDAAFERRLDGVVREIGERGKLLVASESGQEITEPTPAPAPAKDVRDIVASAKRCTEFV